MQVAAVDLEIPPEASTFPPLSDLMDAPFLVSSDTSIFFSSPKAGDTS